MSDIRESRSYSFHGLRLEVSCSEAIASALDNRFRLLPLVASLGECLSFDFQSVPDASQHAVEKPGVPGLRFYEFHSGEALYFKESDQLYLSFGEGVRVLCRPREGCVYFSVIESEPVNLFVASHLLFTIVLVEMLKRRGRYSLHAAGFSDDGKAILIPGTSGAGKSTLAVALLRNGFGYLSDDMVFVCRNSDGLRVLSFPEDIDVSDQTIRFFPELGFLESTPKSRGWSKRQVRADEVYGVDLVQEAEPGAIIIPQIAHRETSELRRIAPDEALLEIVSNVLLTERCSCQSHLDILKQLVMSTPCYRLETGHDFDRIPVFLRELLNSRQERVHV